MICRTAVIRKTGYIGIESHELLNHECILRVVLNDDVVYRYD